jgi:hypothetical protein
MGSMPVFFNFGRSGDSKKCSGDERSTLCSRRELSLLHLSLGGDPAFSIDNATSKCKLD